MTMPGYIHTIQAIRFRVKGIGRDLHWLSGTARRYFLNARGHCMLTYHGVCRSSPLRFNTLFVTAKTFEKHLQLYKEYCHILSPDDYFSGKFSNDRFNICLSFDDGFANNYSYVLPLLEQYKVPAIFFITGASRANQTVLWNDVLSAAYRYGPAALSFRGEQYTKDSNMRYISSAGKPLADILRSVEHGEKEQLIAPLKKLCRQNEQEYWLQMNEEQVRVLAQNKWATIGCHGLYHDDMAFLTEEQLHTELALCKTNLSALAGKPVTALAFPYGSYTPNVIAAATQAGFTQLYADRFNHPADGQHPSLRERFTINPFINPVNQLYATIRGHY